MTELNKSPITCTRAARVFRRVSLRLSMQGDNKR